MGRRALPVGTWGAITFRKMENGRIRARASYRDLDGVTRPIERYGASKAGAQRELLKALRERTGFIASAITRDSKVSALADKWVKEIENSERAVGTIDSWSRVIESKVKPRIGGLALYEVSVPILEAAISSVREQNGVSAAQTFKTVLSGLFGLAVRNGALAVNPVSSTARITGTKKTKSRSLKTEEAKQLILSLSRNEEAVNNGVRDLVIFMLGTGVRIGEALALRTRFLDLSTGTAEIAATVTEKKGVGTIIVERTKTAASHRVIALPPQVVSMLERRSKMVWPENVEGLIFPNALGKVWPRNKATEALRTSLDDAGIKWATSHTFRRTVATWLDDNGVSARLIADQLGHEKPSITTDTYMGRAVVTAHASELLIW